MMKKLEETNIFSVLVVVLLILQIALTSVQIIKLNQYVALTLGPTKASLENQDIEFVEAIPISDDPYIGNNNDPVVTIVGFLDFSCQHCKSAYQAIMPLVYEHRDSIQFVLKDFPVKTPDIETSLLKITNCLPSQSIYWEFVDYIFSSDAPITDLNLISRVENLNIDHSMFNECVSNGNYITEVEQDISEGKKVGVIGTPTFYVNGYRINNWNSVSSIINMLLEINQSN